MMASKREELLDGILIQFGITREPLQEDAPERLADALDDYRSVARQNGRMVAHFMKEEKPILLDGIWLCPKCGKRTNYNYTHCHWCGKKMGWR